MEKGGQAGGMLKQVQHDDLGWAAHHPRVGEEA